MGYGFKMKTLYVEDIAMLEHEFISKAHPLELGGMAPQYLGGVHDFAQAVIDKIKGENKEEDD